MRSRPTRGLAGLLCASMAAVAPPPVWARDSVRCESPNYRYRFCRADTDWRVELRRQISDAPCTQGRSWGYTSSGIWVDRGCAAEFRVGRDHDHGHGDDRGNDKAVIGAVVGLAALAAIAASRQQQDAQEVASWSVGSFRGYDAVERIDVELTIVPGGRVDGRAGDRSFSGSLGGDRLEAGRHVFRIQRRGSGFEAVDERNADHRVVFERSGGGY